MEGGRANRPPRKDKMKTYEIRWLNGCGGFTEEGYGLPEVVTATSEKKAAAIVRGWDFVFDFVLVEVGQLYTAAMGEESS